MESLREVIMRRDDMTEAQADKAIAEAVQAVLDGENPEEVLEDYFGLEPDYIFDILPD